MVAHYTKLVSELTPDLAQFERIKKVALLPHEFSLEAGEITPTLKVKRRVVEERYKAEIDALNVDYVEAGDVRDVVDQADIIYMEPVVQADYTKSRVERSGETGLTPKQYQVSRELLRDKGRRSSIVIHSLPRMDELTEDVRTRLVRMKRLEQGVQARTKLHEQLVTALYSGAKAHTSKDPKLAIDWCTAPPGRYASVDAAHTITTRSTSPLEMRLRISSCPASEHR